MKEKFRQLTKTLDGEFYFDKTMRILYATDASAYREIPQAVAIPKTVEDIKKLIAFANREKTSLIPRTAGTSLAGQVVGAGIVVDVSKYMNQIIELNEEEKWVRVQPGVVRDELNMFLKPYGLYFGPETSTANRAMIGGMVGNNSCGSNSLVYRSTREHLLEVTALLSNGEEVVFKSLSIDEFHNKCEASSLEGNIYKTIRSVLSNYENQEEIRREFPKKTVERRNTGYAIDILLESAPFTAGKEDFNFCKLIAGSEGTLAFLTEIKLNLVPLHTDESGLLCVHFNSIDDSLKANLIGLKYKPRASELIDHYILECTKDNIEQAKNRFFVKGDPNAILVMEYSAPSREEILNITNKVEAELREAGLGYHFPVLFGEDTKKIWTLRKAGLGLLGNMPGKEKAVPVIEDTAVDVADLPDYIREFNEILKEYNLYSVHYAHAGSGEIHLRPILDLKTEKGNSMFRQIALDIASLVKKYKGSLSGEHGDGRLRGEFIHQMIGDKNYELLKVVKNSWDPNNIFNPNKIVDTPQMNTSLRYYPGQETPEFKTVFRFGSGGILSHAEQCNGSGDCRKSHLSGGTMCPSYMATRNEKDTTRSRANVLREFLTRSDQMNRFNHSEILEVMDLCLSCKGCKSECPSNVDMAKLKAEFLQQYYDVNGSSRRAKIIANFSKLSSLGAIAPSMYNFFVANKFTGGLIRKFSGFAENRSLPKMYKTTLRHWLKKHKQHSVVGNREVYFFCDEFTNFNDTEIGIKTVLLLNSLGYKVIVTNHAESGRSWLSKGFVRKAKEFANINVNHFSKLVTADKPLVGVEPSAILTFTDEYPALADDEKAAKELSANVYYIDDFIAREIAAGNINADSFTKEPKKIIFHGHCHQKALSSGSHSVKVMTLPENYTVETLPSGCCGMAGSFGYEKEHYDISMKIGGLVLFPAVKKQEDSVAIAAPGTSCRHQILDGTGKIAQHPVEILYEALVHKQPV